MHLFVSKCVISKCVSYFEIFIQVCIGLTMSLKHLFLSDLHISLRICSFNGWNGKFGTKNLTFCFIYKSMALVIIYLFNSFVKQKAIQFFCLALEPKHASQIQVDEITQFALISTKPSIFYLETFC